MGDNNKFRKAVLEDIPAIVAIYDKILTQEEQGNMSIGWIRDVYPTSSTAQMAVERGDMIVYENNGEILASAIINHIQSDAYANGNWQYKAEENQIMVLHTLTVDPEASKGGIGKKFLAYYEQYSMQENCMILRMDTNEKNEVARRFYKKLGYHEAGIVPCEFNGIPNVQLVLLEKNIVDLANECVE